MPTYTYRLAGDPRTVFDAALAALAAAGYRVTRDSAWSATAETGSASRVVVFGGPDPYVRLGVSVVTQGDEVAVRLVSTRTGAAGGLFGHGAVRQAVTSAGETVRDALAATGEVTVDVTD